MKTAKTAEKKRTVRKDRSALQSKTPPTSLALTVRYRLQTIPSLTIDTQKTVKEDKKIFYAKVVPWRTLHLNDLLARMEEERLPVNPHAARMVLLTAMDTIVRCLKEGNQVTIDGYFTFGLSIPGRVGLPHSPEYRQTLKKAREAGNVTEDNAFTVDMSAVRGALTARPWVRCSPALIDTVNKDLQITQMGVTKPVPEELLATRLARRNQKTKPTA